MRARSISQTRIVTQLSIDSIVALLFAGVIACMLWGLNSYPSDAPLYAIAAVCLLSPVFLRRTVHASPEQGLAPRIERDSKTKASVHVRRTFSEAWKRTKFGPHRIADLALTELRKHLSDMEREGIDTVEIVSPLLAGRPKLVRVIARKSHITGWIAQPCERRMAPIRALIYSGFLLWERRKLSLSWPREGGIILRREA